MHLKKHNAGNILAKLEQSPTTIYIVEYTDGPSYYSPKKKTIFWNPYQGLETTDGNHLSPTTVLNHEADHALDDVENSVQHKIRKNTKDENYDNKEERRVIMGTETDTAIKLGEIKEGELSRDNHLGYDTQTNDPTSSKPISVNLPSLEEFVVTPKKTVEE